MEFSWVSLSKGVTSEVTEIWVLAMAHFTEVSEVILQDDVGFRLKIYLSLISSLKKKKALLVQLSEKEEISILTSVDMKDVTRYMSICHSWD